MRRLFVPTDTASRFLDIASTNTRRDVETCGILAGKFVSSLTQTITRPAHFLSLLSHILHVICTRSA